MTHFDALPGRDRNHAIEAEAIAAFQTRLAESGVFILQGQDLKDYGTDCQIEALVDGRITNARVHVQLKGTEKALNADGSLSVDVRRTNLNYLLMQPFSIYVAYHLPTRALRICTAESVVRHYQHNGSNWTDQKSLTVTFVDELTVQRLQRLAGLAGSGAKFARDRRIDQVGTSSPDGTAHALRSPPDIHVPDEPAVARLLLQQLYEQNADDAISAGFAKFAAVFGVDSDEMGMCYMSEINLGMDGLSRHPERVEEALTFFQKRVDNDRRYRKGSLYYTIGNAFHALRKEDAAKNAYLAALADEKVASSTDLAAQVHKNLGSSYAILGEHDQAVKHYNQALKFNPELAEAHHSLGTHHVRLGQYEQALHHLDQVLFCDQKEGRISAVNGWRANVLFNLGDGRAAFREINRLIVQADRLAWIRHWCCRLVAAFGRANVDNARQAASFWQRYVKTNSDDAARWELLMTTLYLRGQGKDVGKTYSEFRKEFDSHITYIDPGNAALPWDRLGHWAQDNEDWVEAQRCFRKAYELAGGAYGYCLAIALKELGRLEESVPLLVEQAEKIQPDALSWFQLAASYHSLHRWSEAIRAYQAVLALAPQHAVAMFDLGGAHFNSGDLPMAVHVWTAAIARFPDHELAGRLRNGLLALVADVGCDNDSDAEMK